jgi:epoxyqueuosine reductase
MHLFKLIVDQLYKPNQHDEIVNVHIDWAIEQQLLKQRKVKKMMFFAL